jgi:hypothetical protein
MIIDVKEWTQRLQEAFDQILPGKQLKVDEHVKSLVGMIKDSLDCRGVSDEAARQKEIREIIAAVKASKSLGDDDLRLYIRACDPECSTKKIDAASPRSTIINVQEWTLGLQKEIDETFPGRQIHIDTNVRSLAGMIKDSLDRRAILDDAERREQTREIIATVKTSENLSNDLRLYLRTFGAQNTKRRMKSDGETKPRRSPLSGTQFKNHLRKPKTTDFPRQRFVPPPPDIAEITRTRVLKSKDTPRRTKKIWREWKPPRARFVEGGDCCPK